MSRAFKIGVWFALAAAVGLWTQTRSAELAGAQGRQGEPGVARAPLTTVNDEQTASAA